MTRRRQRRPLWLGLGGTLIVALPAASAGGAVSLSSLNAPTVQTLIDLGPDGVTAGGQRYYDFTYVAPVASPAAVDVRVQGVTGSSTDTAGLRFIAAWIASGAGATATGTVSYDVEPVDPARAIVRVGLTSNGTAPSPAAGAFATVTLQLSDSDGTPVAPLLTTFDDGRTTPIDPTAADVDAAAALTWAPVPRASVSDTVTVAAGRAGGTATASVVSNLFTTAAVPEPAGLLPAIVAVAAFGRRRR